MIRKASLVLFLLVLVLPAVFAARNYFFGAPPALERVVVTTAEFNAITLPNLSNPSDTHWPLAFGADGNWDPILAISGPLLLFGYVRSRRLNPFDYAHEDINFSWRTLGRMFNPVWNYRLDFDGDPFRDTPSQGVITQIALYGILSAIAGILGAFLYANSAENAILLVFALPGSLPVITVIVASVRRAAIWGAAYLASFTGFTYGLGLGMGIAQAAATALYLFLPLGAIAVVILFVRAWRFPPAAYVGLRGWTD